MMKRLSIAVAGIFAVGLAMLGPAVAHGPGPVHKPTGRVVTIKAGSPARLTIVHIVRGCHNWTNGSKLSERADVTLRRGGRLTILNQDVDVHRVVQLSGPRVATGAGMMMNASVKLRFVKSGTYRFKTVTSEMSGMVDMKTIGPDYRLVLIVHVR